MSIKTTDLCDENEDEVQIAEPVFKVLGGVQDQLVRHQLSENGPRSTPKVFQKWSGGGSWRFGRSGGIQDSPKLQKHMKTNGFSRFLEGSRTN